MIIAVDFDGTLHTSEWPEIGNPALGAVEVMRRLKDDGHYLIVWTCREGKYRYDMYDWLVKQGIPFDAINDNNSNLAKGFGYNARKIYADIYIDDHNLGGLPPWTEIYDIISGKMKPYLIYKLL